MRGFWLAAVFLVLVPTCFAAQVNVAWVLDNLAEVRLDQMFTMTAGDVSGKALDKFGNDFDSYWRADSHGRAGKVFEAIIANTTNRRAAATRDEKRIVPTAMLGQATHEVETVGGKAMDAWGTVRRTAGWYLSAELDTASAIDC